MSATPEPQAAPLVSVVVPTFREAENLSPLVDRVFAATRAAGVDAEMIVVDDNSNDGTEALVAAKGEQYPVRVIVRTKERGLSSAVVRGFDEARGRFLLCMDADLSHPPAKVPDLVRRLADDECDFVLGSRYVGGGGFASDWPWYRRLNSWAATAVALPLAPVKDPMSGFFALPREAYAAARDRVRPLGYKIGLELMVKCRCRRIVEEPIYFEDRHAGESKLTFRQQAEYFVHVVKLYLFRFPLPAAIAGIAVIALLVWGATRLLTT